MTNLRLAYSFMDTTNVRPQAVFAVALQSRVPHMERTGMLRAPLSVFARSSWGVKKHRLHKLGA